MLAISERVSPCRARCSPRSVGRLTSSSPSFCSTVMSRLMRSSSWPPGPATRTTSGSTVTVTVSGTGMGLRPMRDMRLPDLRDDLAAHAGAPRLVAGHHAARRRDDRRPHAALDLGDAAAGRVVALAGARDAPQPRDRRAAVVGVLQAHRDDLAGPVLAGRDELEGLDVALLAQDPRHLALELGGRDVHRLVRGVDRIADPREEVGDGVGHGHGLRALERYQLDLVIPGMNPLWASSRRQIRQMPNLRYTARGRPQRRHLLYWRVLYLAGRAAATRLEVLAMCS